MVQFDEILDEVFSKAKSAFSFAGQKTGELVGMAKLKYQKETLARDITKAYAKLGAIVYEANTSDSDLEGLTQATIAEITDLNNKLDKIEKETERAKDDFTAPAEEKAEKAVIKVDDAAHEVKDNVVDVTEKINRKADELAREVDKMADDITSKLKTDEDKVTDVVESEKREIQNYDKDFGTILSAESDDDAAPGSFENPIEIEMPDDDNDQK